VGSAHQQELADSLNQLAAKKYGKHPKVTKKTVGRWEAWRG
jgi:hypothetical protein